MYKNFCKSTWLQDALLQAGELTVKGFKPRCERTQPDDFFDCDGDTVMIFPDVDTSELLKTTKITKRISTYRGNFEACITMEDFMTDWDIVVNHRLYLHPYHSNTTPKELVGKTNELSYVYVDDSIQHILSNNVVYSELDWGNFLAGNYNIDIYDFDKNNYLFTGWMKVWSDGDYKFGYLTANNEDISDDDMKWAKDKLINN